ncbi:MAG TPA: hypothetical protein VEW45_01050 [Candidatus Dormibacteraeota bacterium]|nr:hypothetical protein [Candidatus Dormibacteraeota bacterium]
MWLGDEFEAAGLEVATPGWRSEPESSVAPTRQAPLHELSDSDLAQLAQDEGWDTDEVDAIRALLGRSSPQQATPSPVVETADAQLPPDDVHPMDEGEPTAREPLESTTTRPEPMSPTESPTAESVISEAPMAEPMTTEPPEAEVRAEEAPASERSGPAGPAIARPPTVPVEESLRESIAARPPEEQASSPEPEWLRRRRGPAAKAYRRLRRLLPG